MRSFMLAAGIGLCSMMYVVADDLVFDGDSPAGNAWESPQNWSPEQTPGSADQAFVGGGLTSLLSQAGQAVNVLYIGHDNLPAPGPGTLILSSGSFSSTAARVGASTNVIRNPGTYKINGGTWNVGHGGAVIGHTANGTFNLSGGTVQAAAGLEIGWTDATGVVSVIDGAYHIDAGGMQVGKGGAGTFNLSGGTVLVTDGVEVGAATGGAGTFNISGGTFGIASGGFSLGSAAGAAGRAGIGSGTFNIDAGGVQVGKGGAGTFLVDGGIVHAVGGVDVGEAASGEGTFNISGGTFNVPFGGTRVGKSGTGTFNLSGGTYLVEDGMTVGANPGGAGTFNMVGGTYNLQSGAMVLGLEPGSAGSAGIGSGTFNIQAGGMQVGKGGQGTFNLSGGTVQVADGVEVGSGPAGAGTFNVSGGTFTIASLGLTVGSATGATGYAGIGSGTFQVSGGGVQVGKSGAGTFNISGGTVQVADGVEVGVDGIGSGTFNISGGLVHVPNSGVRIGRAGAGTFNLSGGTVLVSEGLQVGSEPGGLGTFNIGGGTVLVSGGDLRVGAAAGGRGTYNLSDGVVGVRTGNVLTAFAAGGAGTFNLSGGTMYIREGSLGIGYDTISSNSAVLLDGAVLDLNRGEVVLSGSEHPSNQFVFTSGTLGNLRVFAGNLHHRGGRLDIGPGVSTMLLQPQWEQVGEYHMYAAAELRIKIHGTAGPGTEDGHDQISTFGKVDLDADGSGGGKLLVRVDKPLPVTAIGAVFVIIENFSTSQVNGAFANATGMQVTGSNGEIFAIDYAYESSGDLRSNDVALVLQSVATTSLPVYVPDIWKLLHWESVYLYPGDEADTDGDGHSSVEEFIAGTNPNHADSVFRIAGSMAGDSSVVVQFDTVTGRLYHVDGSSDLLDGGAWAPVTSDIPGTGAQVVVPDTTSVYRVYRGRVNLAP